MNPGRCYVVADKIEPFAESLRPRRSRRQKTPISIKLSHLSFDRAKSTFIRSMGRAGGHEQRPYWYEKYAKLCLCAYFPNGNGIHILSFSDAPDRYSALITETKSSPFLRVLGPMPLLYRANGSFIAENKLAQVNDFGPRS